MITSTLILIFVNFKSLLITLCVGYYHKSRQKITINTIAMRIKALPLFFFVFFSITNTVSSQSLPDSTIKKIDKLFAGWNNKNSPGCAVGIVKNDSLIFAKGYGIANLEYGITITP